MERVHKNYLRVTWVTLLTINVLLLDFVLAKIVADGIWTGFDHSQKVDG